MKTCTKCGAKKEETEFYKQASKKDGLHPNCKACCRAYAQTAKGRETARAACERWRQRHPERNKLLQRQYRRTEMGRANTRRNYSKERALDNYHSLHEAHPERLQARWAIKAAIQYGKLPPAKTQTCVRCGERARYWHHHHGYAVAHRLDVVPLCSRCHAIAHFPEVASDFQLPSTG